MRMLRLLEQLPMVRVAEHRNALWIFAERIFNSVLSFLAIIAITRLLGPLNYAHWAFAISITGIMLATGHLGLDGLLIKRLMEEPGRSTSLLGTVLAMKLAVYLPTVIGVLWFLNSRDGVSVEERHLVSILMVPVLLAPFTSSVLAWTNATSLFTRTAIVRIAATLAGTGAKLAAIMGGFGIMPVGYAHAGMFALELCLLLLIVRMNHGPMPWTWRIKFGDAQSLLSQSLSLYAGTVFATLYFNVDIISMRIFFGPLEVGHYALVPQLLQAVQLVPYAVTLSSFPALVALAKGGGGTFHARIVQVTRQLVILAALMCAVLVGFAVLGFQWVFGTEFRQTIPILIVGTLSIPFLFLRQLTTKIFICTNHGFRLALIELAGLTLSVGLSVALVPLYGAMAAVGVFSLTCAFTVVLSFIAFDKGQVLARLLCLNKIDEIERSEI